MLIFDQFKKNDRHLQFLAACVLAGLLVLLAGLWYVQVVSTNRYRAELQDQSFRIVRVPAIRGKILDRNGIPLAENRASYNVNLYLEDLSRRFRKEYAEFDREFRRVNKRRPAPQEAGVVERQIRFRVAGEIALQVIASLKQPQPLDEKKFNRHFAEMRALPFPILEDLQPEQMALFVERGDTLPALNLEIQAVRVYPHASSAAHLLGHLRRDNASEDQEADASFDYRLPDFKGEMGVEAAFDDDLRGKPGIKSILVNNLNYRQSETVWSPPVAGRNVILTIDLPIQQAAEQALHSGGEYLRGAAVVMDCRSGEIYALASAPAFDPNQFLGRISDVDWALLNHEKFKPMYNRAVYGAYPPGSAFKIISGLACLESGLDVTERLSVQADAGDAAHGCIFVGQRKIKDTAPPGEYDFRRAFIKSSNSYFVHQGLRTGVDHVLEWGRRFHLGEPTGLNTRQEVGGYFPHRGQSEKRDGGGWLDGDTANLCIGQGDITVTPLQMAVVVAAVANGGKILIPRLVSRVESQEANAMEEPVTFPAQMKNEIQIKPRSLEILRAAMRADVEDADGTGHAARVEGFTICGKTGTAQVTQGKRVIDHITWFVSYAPFESPRYAVAVVVESGGSGGGTCAPIARKIYEGIQKRERAPAKLTPAMVKAN